MKVPNLILFVIENSLTFFFKLVVEQKSFDQTNFCDCLWFVYRCEDSYPNRIVVAIKSFQ